MQFFIPILSREKSTPPQDDDPPIDPWDTGKNGERYTKDVLQSLKGYKQFLSNCYFHKFEDTYTEVDLILLHESGIYVIESKNYSGWIFGGENQRFWTQSLASGSEKTKKTSFFNPIWQNKGHLKALKNFLDLSSDVPCYSFVVFSDRCDLKKLTLTSGEHFVVNRRDLLQAVQKNAKTAGRRLTRGEIDTYYQRLHPLTQVSEEQKALHAEAVRQKKEVATTKPAASAKPTKSAKPAAPAPKKPSKQEERVCPRCGGKLVLRTAGKGEHAGEQFWGCSNFTNHPKCWYREYIEEPADSHS